MSGTSDRTHSPDAVEQRVAKKRRITKRPTVHPGDAEQPGDPTRPHTFLFCHESESKTAAYLGYTNTSDLRNLAVSWPVLRAMAEYSSIASHLNGKLALGLLGEDPDLYSNVTNLEVKWPFSPDDDRYTLPHKKLARMAAILSNMKNDLANMETNSVQQNQKLQGVYHTNFSRIFTKSPVFLFQHDQVRIRAPIMRPLEGETPVEPFNRCFVLLRCARHQLSTKDKAANYATGPAKGFRVKKRNIPAWMRSAARNTEFGINALGIDELEETVYEHTVQDQDMVMNEIASRETQNEITPHVMAPTSYELQATPNNTAAAAAAAAAEAAEDRPRLRYMIWDQTRDHDDLQEAIAHFRKLPSTDKMISPNASLFESAAEFRDKIREQYRCNYLRMQIVLLELHYNDGVSARKYDCMVDDWEDVRTVISQPTCKDFIFHVSFGPVDGKTSVFEI